MEIHLSSSSDTLFKPNVERENKTFKGRLIYSRKIDNSSSIKYKSKYYIPVDIETGEIISFEQNTIGIIIIAYDNSYWCNIDETIYKLHEIKAPEKKIYQKTTKSQEEINKSKAHKPAPNHP